MQILCFSYICTTVRTGTCGLTLGVHACPQIAEMEITNIFQLFSKKCITSEILHISSLNCRPGLWKLAA